MDKEKVFNALRKRVTEEPFARKMGLELKEIDEGYALVEMKLTEEMGNIYESAHGGAIFALIDEAFEIAGNSHGTVAVALNMNITYIAAPNKGALLQAEAKEVNQTRKTANYQITVKETDGRLTAICQALVYRKGTPIPFVEE